VYLILTEHVSVRWSCHAKYWRLSYHTQKKSWYFVTKVYGLSVTISLWWDSKITIKKMKVV